MLVDRHRFGGASPPARTIRACADPAGHPGARDGQPLLAIGGIVHAGLLVLEVSQRLADDASGAGLALARGRPAEFRLPGRQLVDHPRHTALPDPSDPALIDPPAVGHGVGRWHGRFVHPPIPLAIRERNQVDPNGDLWMSVLEATGQPTALNQESAQEVSVTGDN